MDPIMPTWTLIVFMSAAAGGQPMFMGGQYQSEIKCNVMAERQMRRWRFIYGKNIEYRCRYESVGSQGISAEPKLPPLVDDMVLRGRGPHGEPE